MLTFNNEYQCITVTFEEDVTERIHAIYTLSRCCFFREGDGFDYRPDGRDGATLETHTLTSALEKALRSTMVNAVSDPSYDNVTSLAETLALYRQLKNGADDNLICRARDMLRTLFDPQHVLNNLTASLSVFLESFEAEHAAEDPIEDLREARAYMNAIWRSDA